MSKRKSPTHRTPGTLSPFARGEEAADRMSALDAIVTAAERAERVEPPPQRERPVAITGAMAPPGAVPLAELSELVGREVADVGRPTICRRGERGPGVHQPKGWTLWFAGGGHSMTFESNDLRRDVRLNEVAVTHWRRPLDLPRLTNEDGRRVIRLLHEVIEARASRAVTDKENGR